MSWKPEAAARRVSSFIAENELTIARDLAGGALISALGCCWSAIRQFGASDLPEVVLVAAPMGGSLGSFAPLRWLPRHGRQAVFHEVMVSVDSLALGPEETLATLLHEAAHALNWLHLVPDCSRSQYHNRHFAAQADRLGLVVSRVAHYGFSQTQLAPATVQRYADQLALLDEVLVQREIGVDTPRAGESRNLRAVCACGFVIRLSRKTLSATTVQCGTCGQAFRAAR